MTLAHYNARMFLYMGAADAFSTCLRNREYDEFFRDVLKRKQYHVHTDDADLYEKGVYTDETEMALAMAQLLTRDAPPIISYREIARALVTTFDRGGRRHGYDAFGKVLVEVSERYKNDPSLGITTELCRTTISRHVMLTPAVVCGVVPNLKDGLRVVGELGRLFNVNEVEKAAIKLLMLYSHYALHTNSSFREFPQHYRAYLLECIPPVYSHLYGKDFPEKWKVGQGTGHGCVSSIVNFVSSVLQKDFQSMELILDYCLRQTGAVDTAATVLWGIVSARRSDDPLPEFFMRDLKDVDFLQQKGEKLMKKFS